MILSLVASFDGRLSTLAIWQPSVALYYLCLNLLICLISQIDSLSPSLKAVTCTLVILIFLEYFAVTRNK